MTPEIGQPVDVEIWKDDKEESFQLLPGVLVATTEKNVVVQLDDGKYITTSINQLSL